MFTDLQNVVDFDTATNLHFTFIESSQVDASFLIHHFLSYCIKRDHRTLFLTLSQTLSHYKSIQTKLGNANKLAKLIEGNVVTHVDCLKFTSDFASSSTADSESENRFLNQVMSECKFQLNKGGEEYSYLIIDDLTIAYLLSSKGDYKKLYEFLFSIKNAHKNLKIIVYMQSFENSDDQNLSNLIKDFAYLADLYFKVDQLETGYSKDIHGQLTMYKSCFPFKRTKQGFLFKITDKNVNLHTVGSIV